MVTACPFAMVMAVISFGLITADTSGWGGSTTPRPAGGVQFFVDANSRFDRFTRAPSAAQQAWMAAHYWRLLAYPPYFDWRLAWFPNAWAYADLYAIYVGRSPPPDPGTGVRW